MDPVSYAKLELLPTDTMPWERLEKLLRRILQDVDGLRHVRSYGELGQAQYGIDVVGTAVDGGNHAVQGKRYQKFTETDLTAAVNKFITERGNIPFSISRFIVATGCAANRTQVTNELYRLQEAHTDVSIELWDQRTIADRLRNRPDIVVEFFGEQVSEMFCLPAAKHVVGAPSPTRVDLAEALVRGPAAITKADGLLAEADRLEGPDPLAAAKQLEQAGRLLNDGGFAAHASVILQRRAALLARARDHDGAARLLSDAFWQAVTAHERSDADELARQLNTVARTHSSQALARIAAIAVQVTTDPLGATPAFTIDELGGDATRLETARLLVLVAQNAAIDPTDHWRADHVEEILAQTRAVADVGESGAELACLLRVEVADVTGDWAELVSDARRGRMPRAWCTTVLARHALHYAERGEPESASQSWEDAMTQACLNGQNDAAADYVFSRRMLRARFERLQASDDDWRLERSLRKTGDKVRSPAETLESKALRALADDKPRLAVPLLRALHRETYSSGAWGHLSNVRALLAGVYGQVGEEALAARLFALAGQSKKAAQLAKSAPALYLDMRDCLSHPAYWVAAIGYEVLAEQGDLVPDEHVAAVGESALAVLDAARAGTLQDSMFAGPSIQLNAIKALTALAERLPFDQAERLLSHLEPSVPRQPNTYRPTDDHHVRACVRIADAHENLRSDAIEQLLGLLAANDSGVSAQVEREAEVLVQDYPDLVKDRLSVMAGQQNNYARRLLRLISNEATPELTDAAAAAADRLKTPPGNTATSVGIGTGAPAQAQLAASLPTEARRELARLQLAHARSPYEPGHNRAEYIDAARILAHDIDDVDDLFREAIALASDPLTSLGDVLSDFGSHPLGAVRSSGMINDSRPNSVYLAAALARTTQRKGQVRDLAYTLIGSSERAGWYVAQTLQHLDLPYDHALPLLATQSHWALRSVAAIFWARSTAPAEIGLLLAQDDSPQVRRALASAVAGSPTNAAAHEVRQQLSADRCYSVRKLVRNTR